MKTPTGKHPVRLPIPPPGKVHKPKKGKGSYDRKKEKTNQEGKCQISQ